MDERRDCDDLLTLSRDILEALRTKDVAYLAGRLHPDFVHVTNGGARQSKEEFLDAILVGGWAIDALAFEQITVDRFSDIGVVCGVQRADVTLQDGAAVIARTHFTDVFVATSSGWLLRHATAVELES